MATWDGSYPEDLNYLVYADRNATDAAAGNWQCFVGNTAYLRDIPAGGYYPGTRGGRQVYEQSGSTAAFYQVGAQHSNMVPLENNACQEHVRNTLPNVSYANSTRASDDIVPTSYNTPSFSRGDYKPRSRGNRATGKHAPPPPTGDIIQSTVVENSNLHPMANEFVPNNQIKFKKDSRFRRYDNGNATGSGFNAYVQEQRTKSADKLFLSNNRYKNERRYDNRRDVNYRQKKSQDTQILQAPRSSYRDTQRVYNARKYNKFQNGKYYNRKHQSDIEKHAIEETRRSTTEATDSTASNSQENKAVEETVQEDDSFSSTKISRSREETSLHEDNDSENMFSKILEQRNGRSKRFTNASNYYRYNLDNMQSESGARRKTLATTAKYTQRRNNEVPSYKEKKIENWRDRTESNEHTLQGKNPKKKYDIGIFIKFIKEIALLLYKKKFCN